MKKSCVLAMVVAFAVGLSGCASTPSNSDDSGAVVDETQTKTEGALVGALLGGLLGAAIGDGNRGQAVMIGAAVGAGAGYLMGNEIAKRKKKYASDEEFLDGEIASTQELNQTAADYNASLEEEIAQLDIDTENLKAEYDAGRISYSQLEMERKIVREKIDSSGTVLEDLRKEYEIKVAIHEEQQKRRDAGDADITKLEEEISLLKENIDELNQHSQQLASIDDRLER